MTNFNIYFTLVLFTTDVRTALIGVGLVVKDDKNNVTILDKGETFFLRLCSKTLGTERVTDQEVWVRALVWSVMLWFRALNHFCTSLH